MPFTCALQGRNGIPARDARTSPHMRPGRRGTSVGLPDINGIIDVLDISGIGVPLLNGAPVALW
ncbi:hypothetical protein [Nitratidesulfovibrio vulgaris]|uniref:hypothetical protein n=1 Tax=Nitratidesulfovibrio vulgaris TaxID=881 RepID=UPI0013E8ADD7|nr:hypothetical protein [Nitratidesulfovibrio vulgaris]WCB45853.1 hypothetical protein PH214_12445 [Nitratidesulfovibrio vulgaris]